MAGCTHINAAKSLKIQIPNSDYEADICMKKSPEPRTCCGKDLYHRRLSIASVICGCSCISIFALINSVKAQDAHDPADRKRYSQQAKKYAWTSIAVFFGILLLIPLLTFFISYLITLRE